MSGKFGTAAIVALLLAVSQAAVAADGSSYQGKVRPLVTPILLRYAPVDSITLEIVLRASVSGSAPKSATVTALSEGKVVQAGELLEWRQSMWFTEGTGNPKDSGRPFITTFVLDRRGNWTSVQLSGVNLEDGTTLRKGTAAYDKVVDQMASSLIPFPERAIEQGDDLLAGLSDAAKVRAFGSDLGADGVTIRSIRQIVTGETTISGRRGIVTQLTGDLDISIEGRWAPCVINGFVVFDVATGQRLDGHLTADAKVGDDIMMRVDFDLDGSVD